MEKISEDMIAILGSSIAVELAKDKCTEEINVMRNLLSQISSTLLTILSQRILNETTNKDCKK